MADFVLDVPKKIQINYEDTYLHAAIIWFLKSENSPYVVVLGIAQDGGLPHAGCVKSVVKNHGVQVKMKKYPP